MSQEAVRVRPADPVTPSVASAGGSVFTRDRNLVRWREYGDLCGAGRKARPYRGHDAVDVGQSADGLGATQLHPTGCAARADHVSLLEQMHQLCDRDYRNGESVIGGQSFFCTCAGLHARAGIPRLAPVSVDGRTRVRTAAKSP